MYKSMYKSQSKASKARTATMQVQLKTFTRATAEVHKTYAFPAGFLEATVLAMFRELSKAQQEHWMKVISEHTDKALVDLRLYETPDPLAALQH